MFYKQELCNLNKPEEANICVKIAGISLQNSEWTLIGGLPSAHYFDIDNYLRTKEDADKLSRFLADKINQLAKEFEFDKVAFIEKGGAGPVGLIAISSFIATLIDKDICIIRPKKKLLKGAIKGTFEKGDRVLILNDVATSGRTIFEAAEKIWDCGGRAPYALVVIDRDQGATVNLGRKGIELFSLFSAKTMLERKGDELVKKFNRTIENKFIPELVDFGGSSVTSIF